MASVEPKASSDEVRAKKREDSAIALILQKAMVPLYERQINCSTLWAKPMTSEQAQKLGPEVLRLWNNWKQFMMKHDMLILKWFVPVKDGYQALIHVPQVASRRVLEQLHDSRVTWGHISLHKTLDRTRQWFWWPMMRRNIDKLIKNCKPCPADIILKAQLQPVTVGVRFAKIAADILGPATRSQVTGSKYILAITDYFTKYVITVLSFNTNSDRCGKCIRWEMGFTVSAANSWLMCAPSWT